MSVTFLAKSIEVSIGIILEGSRVLIARRKASDSLGGYWEFPGGKVEAGETLEQALLRELIEELALTCAIVEPLDAFVFSHPHVRITLHPFIVRAVSGQPQAIDSDEIRWVEVADLNQFQFPPANRRLIDGLQRRFRIDGRAD